MQLIIDRFECDYAVCEKEDGSMLDVKKSEIPISAKEGDVLDLIDGKFCINHEETESRRRIIDEKVRKLFNK